MQIDLFWLIASAAGGFFGPPSAPCSPFIFCGLTVLLGVMGVFGNSAATFISYVPFGPVFGPHIAFAGGVAAVANESRRGYANGKDIVTPLIKLGKIDVLPCVHPDGGVRWAPHADQRVHVQDPFGVGPPERPTAVPASAPTRSGPATPAIASRRSGREHFRGEVHRPPLPDRILCQEPRHRPVPDHC